mgnify:CR=1 FL=1
MSVETIAVELVIFEKSYRIHAPANEQETLKQAARYLDGQMKEIRHASKTMESERVAVMAALNIAHEMLSQQHSSQKQAATMLDDLGTLRARIDATLANIAAR